MLNLEKLNERLNETASAIKNISDDKEKKIYRRAIGDLMSRSFTEIILPLIQEFPYLDPDKDSS